MKISRLMLSFVLIVALAACAGPPNVDAELVGFSSERFTGGRTGVLGYTRACQADFPGSRMCTSEEVLRTVNVPSLPVTKAWVLPSFQPIAPTSDGLVALDASGKANQTIRNFTCSSWISNDSQTFGLTVIVDDTGRVGSFDFGNCAAERSVACCMPTP